MSPKTGLSDEDFAKIDKDTQDQKYQSVKNRYFNLNITDSPYHAVLAKYTNTQQAVFTDMIENSMLDLIIISNPSAEKESVI